MTIQFDNSNTEMDGFNIIRSEAYEDDILFNESYMVVGSLTTEGAIHATYDLTVIGDIQAGRITVNGKLSVFGNVKTDYLQVQNDIYCSGSISAKELNGYKNIFSNEISSEQLYCGNKVMASTIINIDKSIEVDETIMAYEGIVGGGSLKVKNAIVNDYFEFEGHVQGNIFEISTMKDKSIKPEIQNIQEKVAKKKLYSITEYAELYRKLRSRIFKELDKIVGTEDENTLINAISSFSEISVSFKELYSLFEKVVEYSYKTSIDNIYDYLLLIKAEAKLPESLSSYETVNGVFDIIMDNAGECLSNLNFKVQSQRQLAEALEIAIDYKDSIEENDFELIMDAIYSFIGLRYSTVKKILNEV